MYLRPADFKPGLEVTAIVFPLSPKKSKKEFDEQDYNSDASSVFRESIKALGERESAEAMIQILLLSETGESPQCGWLIEKGRAKAINSDQQAAFDTALKSLVDSSDIESTALRIQILTRADADKIQKFEEEAAAKDDEEEDSNILPQPIE